MAAPMAVSSCKTWRILFDEEIHGDIMKEKHGDNMG
jgi:hypothetical protein